MNTIRTVVRRMLTEGRTDSAILAQISNRPTPEQLAELKGVTSSAEPQNAARAMVGHIQSIIDEVKREE